MCHIATVRTVALGSLLALTAAAQADVVIRGPFGRQIVIPSPSDVLIGGGAGVRVGPTSTMPPGPLPGETIEPPLAVGSPPPPNFMVPAPQPNVNGPITVSDFVKTFKPVPGTHTVTFVHTRTNEPVTVAFELPQGNPRVLAYPHAIVFDYGRQEVEIRFQIGGTARVMTR